MGVCCARIEELGGAVHGLVQPQRWHCTGAGGEHWARALEARPQVGLFGAVLGVAVGGKQREEGRG